MNLIEYWKKRCELAEAYIERCPCDNDIYEEQLNAWDNWCEFKKLVTTDVIASLPSKDKLYSMAKLIVDRQQKILTIPNKEAIDWNDLTDGWYDWLEKQLTLTDVSKSFYCEKQTNLSKQCSTECDYCKSIGSI